MTISAGAIVGIIAGIVAVLAILLCLCRGGSDDDDYEAHYASQWPGESRHRTRRRYDDMDGASQVLGNMASWDRRPRQPPRAYTRHR
jgi:hypothetical protein